MRKKLLEIQEPLGPKPLMDGVTETWNRPKHIRQPDNRHHSVIFPEGHALSRRVAAFDDDDRKHFSSTAASESFHRPAACSPLLLASEIHTDAEARRQCSSSTIGYSPLSRSEATIYDAWPPSHSCDNATSGRHQKLARKKSVREANCRLPLASYPLSLPSWQQSSYSITGNQLCNLRTIHSAFALLDNQLCYFRTILSAFTNSCYSPSPFH
ncbi:hypothetical protein CONLIGDRAFT_677575 [Coniochaeta ligniaria NRRL 30616]|uniref:Uncharacterized protein n=1 Tax=Coniochaeta ligniaria NRRL 30616 TaxID=1408157 RepID=A0A1J7J1D1_9PEZI|nr:hypothetical protein CONLIGDRAFT_677575 [Coniochaeta ligniaria NRRL 30616]